MIADRGREHVEADVTWMPTRPPWLKAVEAPLREIVFNAGGEASVVVNAVLNGKGNYGFNAANDTYGDMIEMGILDPTKVTRMALQNAASVASLMLTTGPARGV